MAKVSWLMGSEMKFEPSHARLKGGFPVCVFVWGTFGPYHVDRCEAVERGLAGLRAVVGVEITSSVEGYEWASTEGTGEFNRITLFPGTGRSETRWAQRLGRLVRTLRQLKAQEIFFCNYNKPEIFLCAAWMRLLGRRPYSMQDSKVDDKPRRLYREVGKSLLFSPYVGAMVSGARAEEYARFLGFQRRPVARGYNTLSIDRVRRNAGIEPAPGGTPFPERHFTVIARLAPKKNLFMVLEAYRMYREQVANPRDLVICGSGELHDELIKGAERQRIEGIRWEGFLQEKEIAVRLSTSLALLLPSTEEQWGLVVNEALALGVPVICSTAVGACDLLVRTAVDGYIAEPDNPAGFAAFMCQLHQEPKLWIRLSSGAAAFADKADVKHFVTATRQLIGLPDEPNTQQPSPHHTRTTAKPHSP